MGAVGLKLFFGNEDQFTRDYVSKLAGETEVSIRNSNGSRAVQASLTTGETISQAKGNTIGTSESRGDGQGSGSSHGLFGVGLTYSRNRSRNRNESRSESTTETQTTGRSKSWTEGETTSTGHQISRQIRPLIRSDEVGRDYGRIDDEWADGYPGSVLVMVSGRNPIRLRRSLYFQEKMYEGWYDPHPAYPYPPTLAQRLDSEIAQLKQEQHKAGLRYQALRQKAANDAREAYRAGEEARQKEWKAWQAEGEELIGFWPSAV